MRSMRLLTVAVLAVVLAFSSVGNVYAAQWIVYDDDTWDTAATIGIGEYAAVKFSLSTVGLSGQARLLAARVNLYQAELTGTCAVEVYVFGSDGAIPLTAAYPLSFTCPLVPDQWFYIDLSSRGIIVSDDFWIAVKYVTLIVMMSEDMGLPVYGRSYCTTTGVPGVWTPAVYNYMIRAEVGPIGPVGGVVMPANTLAVLAPWLAIVGLVGCMTIVVVVAKKRSL